MKEVLIIGSGLSGLSCAVSLAQSGITSTVVSPYPSERAQSVMAAGGINAALGLDDSPERHAEDTWQSGGEIAGKDAVSGLCYAAPEIIRYLEGLGVVFSRERRDRASRIRWSKPQQNCLCRCCYGKANYVCTHQRGKKI